MVDAYGVRRQSSVSLVAVSSHFGVFVETNGP